MGILGNVSLAMMDAEEGSILQERLKNMEGYVRHASDLTRQLLGFARGGKYEVKKTDIGAFIRKSTDMFARTRREVRVHTLADPGVWTAEIDRPRWSR
jgi:signal transduction histidine kinase